MRKKEKKREEKQIAGEQRGEEFYSAIIFLIKEEYK